MKVFNIIQILVLSLGLSLYLSACSENGQAQKEATESVDQHAPESGEGHAHEHMEHTDQDHDETHTAHGEDPAYTSAYVCPMHCEGSGSPEAGKCPVCGMTYVAQADHVKDGHDHEE